MNGHFWRRFFLTAFNPVFYQGQTYVDLGLFSKEEYPALRHLSNQSTLTILLLAEIILQSEQDDPQDQACSGGYLYELFANYDCINEEIDQALTTLYKNYWTEIFVNEGGTEILYQANLQQLVKEGLYTPNNWRNLYQLGLYGSRLCSN